MTIVSSKEFSTDQEKYFDLALDEQVYVKRNGYMFQILCSNLSNIQEQTVLEPDDDLRNGISKEEFKERAHIIIHDFFVNK